MTDMNEKKGSQTSLAAIIGTLLVGLIYTNGTGGDSSLNKPGKNVQKPATVAAENMDSTGYGHPLAPLEEVLFGRKLSKDDKAGVNGGSNSDASETVGIAAIDKEYGTARGQLVLHSLVAFAPEPVKASVSFRFDESIEAIERAAASKDYVLERWRFPWEEKATHEKPQQLKVNLGGNAIQTTDSKVAFKVVQDDSTTVKRKHEPSDPGLLVFRKVFRKDKQDDQEPTRLAEKSRAVEFLVVFLIPETPTQGIDRAMLKGALQLTEEILVSRFHPKSAGEQPQTNSKTQIQLVGPCFSGSMPSLRDGLLDWLTTRNNCAEKPWISVISGSATSFEKELFEKSLESHGTVQFHSTVHRAADVLKELLTHLGHVDGVGESPTKDYVILSELNTGAGVNTGGLLLSHPSKSISLKYPLHIAEIRRAYETQGLFRNHADEALRASLEIRELAEETPKPRDILPDQTPGHTAISENRALTQALRYLQDGRFRTIGINATDPHDSIFLARLLSRYCPDARVFISAADLMFLDPESITDMRGVLIGTTYPLFPLNHEWTSSNLLTRGEVFPSQHSQGTYNATALSLNLLLGKSKDDRATNESLVEYGTPTALSHSNTNTHLPPIWISKVGERALYPVKCCIPADNCLEGQGVASKRYLYTPETMDPRQQEADLIKIDRIAGCLTLLGLVAVVTLMYQIHRLRIHRKDHDSEPCHFKLVNLSIFLLFAFVAWPFYCTKIPRLGIFQEILKVLIPISYLVFALTPLPFLQRASNTRRMLGVIEFVGAAFFFLFFTCHALYSPENIGPFYQLQAVRMTSLTSGLSILVPLIFLVLAAFSWGWTAHRLERINKGLGLPSLRIKGPPKAMENELPSITSLKKHRKRFDRLFNENFFMIKHSEVVWIFILAAVFVDTVWLRPLSWSDEGKLFDRLVYTVAFLVLAWIGKMAIQLTRAWSELRITLRHFNNVLGRAFVRIPSRASSWYLDPHEARKEYAELIIRQVEYTKSLLPKLQEYPIQIKLSFKPEELETSLDILKKHSGVPPAGRGRETQTIKKIQTELEAIHAVAVILNSIWIKRPVTDLQISEKKTDSGHSFASHSDQLLSQFHSSLEDLLGLEAARWIGGALSRIWTLAAFLVISSVCLLLTITSYPFPEQPREMSFIGVIIAILTLLILRIAIATNRNEALSLLSDNDPGKFTWDASFLSHIGAYVLPLVGVLTALSFDTTDLFRSILGPILRMFP